MSVHGSDPVNCFASIINHLSVEGTIACERKLDMTQIVNWYFLMYLLLCGAEAVVNIVASQQLH